MWFHTQTHFQSAEIHPHGLLHFMFELEKDLFCVFCTDVTMQTYSAGCPQLKLE